MSYDLYLLERVRHLLQDIDHVRETKMMGGLCFMVNEKMCIGIDREKDGSNRLMLRLDPDQYQAILNEPGVRQMDMTGRPMKGFVFVEDFAFEDESQLRRYVDLALAYNPKARASKKRARKVQR